MQKTIIDVLQHIVLTLAARGPMADDGGPWLMLSGERRRMRVVVETDGRWKLRMEGEWGIPMSFPTQNRTNLIFLSMYIGINNALLSGPHAQNIGNNK